MTTKWSRLVLLQSVFLLFAAFPAWAQDSHCQDVGGELMRAPGS